MRRAFAALSICALALLGDVRSAKGADFFYMLVFGSESDPKRLRLTHTYATFVRATGDGPDPANYNLAVHTISWVPASLDVQVRRVHAEPGVNLDLHSTMQQVLKHHQNVTMWGPYLISREIYNKSIVVLNKLNSGAERYRALDGPFNKSISDCIHVVDDVDRRFGRRRYPLDRVGKPASAFIAQRIVRRTQFDQSLLDNSWLIPRLGLTAYPMEYVGSQGSARLTHYEIQAFFSRLKLGRPE